MLILITSSRIPQRHNRNVPFCLCWAEYWLSHSYFYLCWNRRRTQPFYTAPHCEESWRSSWVPGSKAFLSVQMESCTQSQNSQQQKLEKRLLKMQVSFINVVNVFGPRFQTINRTQEQASRPHTWGIILHARENLSFCSGPSVWM